MFTGFGCVFGGRLGPHLSHWVGPHRLKIGFAIVALIDGSIFVTSAGVNPTNTIQALALYVADQMKQRLANATLFD